MKIAFHASRKPRAQKALEELRSSYAHVPPEEAEVIVVLGGDGSMLHALHKFIDFQAPLYGMNLGTLGFLLNKHRKAGLEKRLEKAERFVIHPLSMVAMDKKGKEQKQVAFNEVSILRETHNSAKLKISVNGKERIGQLVCDGVIVATPVGSTAYNSSAGGPILPLNANVMPITPISPFRPRRWSGALVEDDSIVDIEVLNPVERPVSATADFTEIRDVKSVHIEQSEKISKTILFDPDNHLAERIFKEQFAPDD